jgi:hypothetical protein
MSVGSAEAKHAYAQWIYLTTKITKGTKNSDI